MLWISSSLRAATPVELLGLAIDTIMCCLLFGAITLNSSLLFLPATPSSLNWTLNSPRALLPELQRYKDTVRCAALGKEVPEQSQKQLTQTLIVLLLKTHFFTPILYFEKSTE